MFNIALRWTWNDAEAQELVQETFVRVWARRRHIAVETVSSYAYRTLLNLCQKHARRRERWSRAKALFGATSVDHDTPESTADDDRLRAAIEALPDAQRQVVLLTEYSDLKHQEIGQLLGIPTGTVGSRRNAAIKSLREALS